MFRKYIIAALAAALLPFAATAQDWPNLARYRDSNAAVASSGGGRVVLMGDSITDGWIDKDAEFFEDNGFLCRGISGQTTPQMLIRFRHDVVETDALAVAILAGTNDIAGNTGPSSLEMIFANIASMCDIARSNGVRPLICSVLPAHRYPWSPDKRPDILIPQLNAMLQQYAREEKIDYVDYFSALVDTENPENENGLPAKYSKDGVHPNPECYKIMDEILLKALGKSTVRKSIRNSSK